MDVLEVPDTVPVLIGQLPLEHLDFIIDPRQAAPWSAIPPTTASTCTSYFDPIRTVGRPG